MKKYLVSFLAVLILFMGLGEVFVYGQENDEEIKTFGQILQEVGLIKGDGTSLNAQGKLTREEIVTIINRLYRAKSNEALVELTYDDYMDLAPPEKPSLRDAHSEEYEVFIPPVKATFTDVPKSHWAYKDVEFAYAKGISKGISDQKFGLGDKVNANQTALLLIRIMGYDDEIMEEKIEYKNAYRKVMLLLDISASHVKDPLAPLLRGDVFQMIFDSLFAKTPQGTDFVYHVFGHDYEMWWKLKIIFEGDRYCCYYEMHDIIPPDKAYYTSFLPIFKTKEELFKGYMDFQSKKITDSLDMAYHSNLKSYLVDLNKSESREFWEYTNAVLIKELKRDNNIFVETINDIISGEMKEISWQEFENLVGDYISFDLSMWTPYRDSPDEYTYLHPYKASATIGLSPRNKLSTLLYNRLAEEGMDGENDLYEYEIKSIEVDRETGSKFLFRIRIADDQYQKKDLFFAFEYDLENGMVVQAASSNNMGFGTLNQNDIFE